MIFHCGGACIIKKSQQARHTKIVVYQNFQFFHSALENYLHVCLRFFVDMNTYQRISKHSWKKNAIALDSCYLFTKKILNIELNMILIVFMEFAYIKIFLNFTVDLMNTLQFKQVMNLAPLSL